MSEVPLVTFKKKLASSAPAIPVGALVLPFKNCNCPLVAAVERVVLAVTPSPKIPSVLPLLVRDLLSSGSLGSFVMLDVKPAAVVLAVIVAASATPLGDVLVAKAS